MITSREATRWAARSGVAPEQILRDHFIAWFDRHAARDLFDLAGLASTGVLADPEVAELFRAKHGVELPHEEFAEVRKATSDAWETELAGQVGALPTAEECLVTVRDALGEPERGDAGRRP